MDNLARHIFKTLLGTAKQTINSYIILHQLHGKLGKVRSCIFQQSQQFQHIMQLKDPLKNRIITDVPPPLALSLKFQQLFDKDTVHYGLLKKFYKREGKLSKPLYMELIRRAKFYIEKEPNIVRIDDPVTIVGDIHGQYYDLMTLIDQDIGGSFDDNKYLFLGDYVDRGFFGVEVVGLLMAIKIQHPFTVFMLRGNHQCRLMTTSFNFQTQCLQKYDQQVFQAVMDLFDSFPLAAVVNNKFFCVHGGVSTAVGNLEDISKINRFVQIPKLGGYCDLMWADPVDSDDGKQGQIMTFNATRGCSYFFGAQMAQKFLKDNDLQSIIRAHEVQNEGFKPYFWGGKKEFPTVITLFSAPNYCDYYGNKGAIIKFTNNNFDVQQIEQVAHPYILPDFQDLFKWSFPFLCQNVMELWNFLYIPKAPFNQNEAVPLFLMGKEKVLEKMLGNLKSVTNDYIQKIKNQTPIPSAKYLEVQGIDQKHFRQMAEQQIQKEIQMQKEMLQTTPSISLKKIPNAQPELALEKKAKFHHRKSLDLYNEKRPRVILFNLVLPNKIENDQDQGQQKKNVVSPAQQNLTQ